jgi:hypothetical protein
MAVAELILQGRSLLKLWREQVSEQELSATNLVKQLEGFLDANPYPKSKDAHKAKNNAQELLGFILETFEVDALIKGENKFYETSCVCCNGEHWG